MKDQSMRLLGRGDHHAKVWIEYELFRQMHEKGMGTFYAENSLCKSSEYEQYYMSFIL